MKSQANTILKAMLTNRDKEWWNAKDFQSGEHFVGYEASARMSELKDLPFIEVRMNGRFRELSVNWEFEEDIKKVLEAIELEEKLEEEM